MRGACRADLASIRVISNWAIKHTTANFKVEPDPLEYWTQAWESNAPRYPWFVAESSGSVMGFAMASRFHSRCGYAYTAEVTVYVHPEHHGQGIGQALYDRLIPSLEASGYRTLIAVIATPNPASQQLHAKFGFENVGRLRRVGWKHGRWHDVEYWQRLFNEADDAPVPISDTCCSG